MTVSEQRYGHPMESTFPLIRALMIATQLNQDDLIRTAATKILELGEAAPPVSIGIWDMPSSAFLENRRIPADLVQRMKDQLEARLAEASTANNEWAAQVAGSSLLEHLRPVQDRSERQRIVKVIGEVHRRNADGWPSLRAIGLLRSIAILYEQEALLASYLGDPRHSADQLNQIAFSSAYFLLQGLPGGTSNDSARRPGREGWACPHGANAKLGQESRGQMDDSCTGDQWANFQSRQPTQFNLGQGDIRKCGLVRGSELCSASGTRAHCTPRSPTDPRQAMSLKRGRA